MDWIPQYIRMYAFIDVSMGSYSRGWQLSTYVHAILCILTIIYNCFILLLLVCDIWSYTQCPSTPFGPVLQCSKTYDMLFKMVDILKFSGPKCALMNRNF